MVSSVSLVNVICTLSIERLASDICRCNHQIRADTRRNKIDHVIQLRRCAPEVEILVILISHHRIHRIDRFIHKPENRSSQRGIQHRRDHAVRRVLRNRLHCRLYHSGPIEDIRVSSYNHGYRNAASLKPLFIQTLIHLHTLIL